jgi:PPOX class probable FMN-dependent enzyme
MLSNGSSGPVIATIAELESVYGDPSPPSLAKELDHISDDYAAMLQASPFLVIATAGADGLDCSPRGDARGFVRIADAKTLMIPDRPGNNRTDSLRNIVNDPRVGLLFLIPGIGETLRVNGRATISLDPQLIDSFAIDGKRPRSVLIVKVESVYFQCSKALVRSKLWDPAQHIARSALPSTGSMLARVSKGAIDGAAYDRDLPARVQAMLY